MLAFGSFAAGLSALVHQVGQQGGAADEDRQPSEQLARLGGKQGMAPGDGVAQRPLPRRQITRPDPQKLEAMVSHPLQDGTRRQQAQPDGRQLDRQRQPIQGGCQVVRLMPSAVVERSELGAIEQVTNPLVRAAGEAAEPRFGMREFAVEQLVHWPNAAMLG